MTQKAKLIISLLACLEMVLLGVVVSSFVGPKKTQNFRPGVVAFQSGVSAQSNQRAGGAVLDATADAQAQFGLDDYDVDNQVSYPETEFSSGRPALSTKNSIKDQPFNSGFDTSEFTFRTTSPLGQCIGAQLDSGSQDLSGCMSAEQQRVEPGIRQAQEQSRNSTRSQSSQTATTYVPYAGGTTATSNCVTSALGGKSVSNEEYAQTYKACDSQTQQRYSQYQTLSECVNGEMNNFTGTVLSKLKQASDACAEVFGSDGSSTTPGG